MAPSPADLVRGTLRGTAERPLVVPLASAIAGELRGLEPQALLADAGVLSTLVADLAATLEVDAAVAGFRSYWDAEALGMTLSWPDGFPPVPAGRIGAAEPDLEQPQARVVLDAVARLRSLPGGRLCAAALSGPAELSRRCGGHPSPDAVARLQLGCARALCEAGAGIVFVAEQAEPPADAAAYRAGLAPLLGSIRFFGALAALHLPGDADGWAAVIDHDGPYLPCFDPDASPALAARLEEAGDRLFGLTLPPGAASARARELASGGRCALVTTTAELAGVVGVADLSDCVGNLRAAAAR
jgi:hypothetical protein